MAQKQLLEQFRTALNSVQKKRSEARVSALVKTASKLEKKINKKAAHQEEIEKQIHALITELREGTMDDDEFVDKVMDIVGEPEGLTEPAPPLTEPAPEMESRVREMEENIPGPPRMPAFAAVRAKFEKILKRAI